MIVEPRSDPRNGEYTGTPPRKPLLYGPDGQPIYSDPERFDGTALPHVYTFNAIISGAYNTYWHDRWDEALKHSREDAQAMTRDAFLQSLLQERLLTTTNLKWSLEVDDSRDLWQQAVRDGMTSLVRSTPNFTRMKRYLLDAVWYGKYASQIRWEFEEKNLPDVQSFTQTAGAPATRSLTTRPRRALVVKYHRPVNGDKIGHQFDGTPHVLVNPSQIHDIKGAEIISTTTGGKGLILKGSWRDHIAIHRHQVDDADFMSPEEGGRVHGVGVRHVVYWYWFLKQEFIEWMTRFFERSGLGVRVWYYEASNPASLTEVKQRAKEQDQNVNILVPIWPGRQGHHPGGFEVMDAPVAGAAALQGMVQYVDSVLERYIVGQTLSSGTEGNGLGGSGVAGLHADTKYNIITFDAANLSETMTTDFVKVQQRWTYGRTDFPLRYVQNVDEYDPTARLDAVEKAFSMGVDFRTEDVRGLTGLSAPLPGDATLSAVQAMAQQMAQQQGDEFGGYTTDDDDNDEWEQYEDETYGQSRRHRTTGESYHGDDTDGEGEEPDRHAREDLPEQYAGPEQLAPRLQGQQAEEDNGPATGRKFLPAVNPLQPPSNVEPAWNVYQTKGGEPAWKHSTTGLIHRGPNPPRLSAREVHDRHMAVLEAPPKTLWHAPGTMDVLRSMFPHANLREDETHRLVGAQPGVSVHAHIGRTGGINLQGEGPRINAMHRTLVEDPDTGKMTMYNSQFFLKKQAQGGGFGLKTLSDQAAYLAGLGVDRISTVAGRSARMVGWKVWPLMGYDSQLSMDDRRKLPPHLRNAENVSDLMKTPEGRDWWNRYGNMRFMEFDLTPGSKSWQTLNAYRARKGMPPVQLDAAKVNDARFARASASAKQRWRQSMTNLGHDSDAIHQEVERVYRLFTARNPGHEKEHGPKALWDAAYRRVLQDIDQQRMAERMGQEERQREEQRLRQETQRQQQEEEAAAARRAHWDAVHAATRGTTHPTQFARDDGQWVTIGGGVGEDGHKHGGCPVFIQNGKIVKGPAKLTGRSMGNLGGDPPAEWKERAKAEGVNPRHLEGLAKEMQAHHGAFAGERTKMLQTARQAAKSYGVSLQGLQARNARGKLDASMIPHFDELSTSMAASYPEHFSGTDAEERLFDLLLTGNVKAMPDEDAYEEALAYLASQKPEETPQRGDAFEDEFDKVDDDTDVDEAVPFDRDGEPEFYDWVPEVGPRGGRRWRNTETGDISYEEHGGDKGSARVPDAARTHHGKRVRHAVLDAIVKLGESVKGMPEVQGGVKAFGGAKELAARMGADMWSDLTPEEQQRLIKWGRFAKGVEHYLSTSYRVGEAIAKEAAKERGLPETHVDKVAKILVVADWVAGMTINAPIALAATGNPLVAKAAAYLPVASMAYIAYSTSRNFMATIRAARTVLSRKKTAEAHAAPGDVRKVAAELLQALNNSPNPDWYTALVYVALDKTHDMRKALDLAAEAAKDYPAGYFSRGQGQYSAEDFFGQPDRYGPNLKTPDVEGMTPEDVKSPRLPKKMLATQSAAPEVWHDLTKKILAGQNPIAPTESAPAELNWLLSWRKKKDAAVATNKPIAGQPVNTWTPEAHFVPPPGSNKAPIPFGGGIPWHARRAWIESGMNSAHIAKAARWYREAMDFYINTYGHERGPVMLVSHLMANQNVPPAIGGMNAQRAKEIAVAGMIPAARAGLAHDKLVRLFGGEPTMEGIGRKLSDFIDAGLGRRTRNFYGDHPDAGEPLVIDTHSVRDAGFLDEPYVRSLLAQGYTVNPQWLKKHGLTVEEFLAKKMDRQQGFDPETGTKGAIPAPTKQQYEYARETLLAHHEQAKREGWYKKHGIDDETATAAAHQAIGWVNLTDNHMGASQDSLTAVMYNSPTLVYEAAPAAGSDWDKQFGERWRKLPPHVQAKVTSRLVDVATAKVAALTGVDLRGVVFGTGAWTNPATGGLEKSPNVATQIISSPEGARGVAHALAYVLRQDEVWTSRLKQASRRPASLCVDLVEHGTENLLKFASAARVWKAVQDSDKRGIFSGYMISRGLDGKPYMRLIINQRDMRRLMQSMTPEEKAQGTRVRDMVWEHVDGPLNQSMKGLTDVESKFYVRHTDADVYVARGEHKKEGGEHGGDHWAGILQRYHGDTAARLRNLRSELTQEFAAGIDAAERGR